MPQLSNIVLKDGAATPVDHTFKPRAISGGIASLVESTGVPIGEKTITIGTSTTTVGRRKMTLRVQVPVVQDVTVNGVSKPTAVRIGYADISFAFDGTSGTQERKDLLAFTANLLKDTQVLAVVNDLESLY